MIDSRFRFQVTKSSLPLNLLTPCFTINSPQPLRYSEISHDASTHTSYNRFFKKTSRRIGFQFQIFSMKVTGELPWSFEYATLWWFRGSERNKKMPNVQTKLSGHYPEWESNHWKVEGFALEIVGRTIVPISVRILINVPQAESQEETTVLHLRTKHCCICGKRTVYRKWLYKAFGVPSRGIFLLGVSKFRMPQNPEQKQFV